MNRTQRVVTLLVTVAAAHGVACGPKHIVAAPSRPGEDLIVLLPDADGGVGRATVSNQSGSVDLRAEREATRVPANQPPGKVATLSEADVQKIFGGALSALPPPPRRFTLNFRFESNELSDEAHALVPAILKAVRERNVPDVVIVGHTDTMGSSKVNFELGLKRAVTVRDLLVNAGLDASSIEVRSLGETDLLIQTGDETPEPRNRRVDIAVR